MAVNLSFLVNIFKITAMTSIIRFMIHFHVIYLQSLTIQKYIFLGYLPGRLNKFFEMHCSSTHQLYCFVLHFLYFITLIAPCYVTLRNLGFLLVSFSILWLNMFAE